MYNLEQKLKMETEKNPRVILLFLEGGFYRAYEQSAFLAVKCLQNFKVTLSRSKMLTAVCPFRAGGFCFMRARDMHGMFIEFER